MASPRYHTNITRLPDLMVNSEDHAEIIDGHWCWAHAGWGGPPRQIDAAAARARGRGGRGRRGRGRGARRGGRAGRRGSRGYDDDGSDSESDLPPSLAGDPAGGNAVDALAGAALPPAKVAVEQIYGWRWPRAGDGAAAPAAKEKCAILYLYLWPLHAPLIAPYQAALSLVAKGGAEGWVCFLQGEGRAGRGRAGESGRAGAHGGGRGRQRERPGRAHAAVAVAAPV